MLLIDVFIALLLLSSVALLTEAQRCENGGSVIKTSAGVTVCHCTAGWKGSRCTQLDCNNNRPQVEAADGPRCDCGALWKGRLCAEVVCVHGIWHVDGQRCFCDQEYTGKHCSLVTKCKRGTLNNGVCSCEYGFKGDFCSEHTHDSTVDYTIAGIVALVLLLGACGIIFLICFRDKLYPGGWYSRQSSRSRGISRARASAPPSYEQSLRLTQPEVLREFREAGGLPDSA